MPAAQDRLRRKSKKPLLFIVFVVAAKGWDLHLGMLGVVGRWWRSRGMLVMSMMGWVLHLRGVGVVGRWEGGRSKPRGARPANLKNPPLAYSVWRSSGAFFFIWSLWKGECHENW